jgi:ATP-binding cassette subfamily B multidrug efflux pump
VPAKSEMSKMQFDKTALRRLFSYMKEYKGQLVFVVICILLSAVASATSSVFLQTLIDDYIVPLLGTDNPVFDGLIRHL